MTPIALLNKMIRRRDYIVLLPGKGGGVEVVSSRELDKDAVDNMLQDLLIERRAV